MPRKVCGSCRYWSAHYVRAAARMGGGRPVRTPVGHCYRWRVRLRRAGRPACRNWAPPFLPRDDPAGRPAARPAKGGWTG